MFYCPIQIFIGILKIKFIALHNALQFSSINAKNMFELLIILSLVLSSQLSRISNPMHLPEAFVPQENFCIGNKYKVKLFLHACTESRDDVSLFFDSLMIK